MQSDPNRELLDDVDDDDDAPAPARTVKVQRPSAWCLEAAEAGIEFATALLKFPIEDRPDRPVSLPGYPDVEEVYYRGFKDASAMSEHWDDDEEDEASEEPIGVNDAQWLALDWSRRLLKHLVERFAWQPWFDFEEFSLGYYMGDDGTDEGAHAYHRQLAAGPYCLTAAEARALRIVRKRLRRLLQDAAALPEREPEAAAEADDDARTAT